MIGNALDRLLMDTICDAIVIAADSQTGAKDAVDACETVSVSLDKMKQRRQTSKEEVAAALKKVAAALGKELELRLIVEGHLDSWDRPKPASRSDFYTLTHAEIDFLVAAIVEEEKAAAKEGGEDQLPARCIDPFEPRVSEPAASLDSDIFPLPPMLQAEEDLKRPTAGAVDDEL